MLWMLLVDPKDHILKVSCHYLNFLLSYSGSLNKLLTCQNATVGQKAAVEQGMPN